MGLNLLFCLFNAVYLKVQFRVLCCFCYTLMTFPMSQINFVKSCLQINTSVFYSHKDPNILVKVINEELDKLSSWFKSNKLSLNIRKTSFIFFGTKPNIFNSSMKIQIDNTPIRNVNSARFLGVLVDESLSWKPHLLK